MIADKPDYTEQQCFYCGQWFPLPVCLHHDEAECSANQAEVAE